MGREWRRGRPLTARGLACLLEPLGIHPDRCDTPTGRLRGYRLDAFRDAIARYLPSHASMCPQASVSGADQPDRVCPDGPDRNTYQRRDQAHSTGRGHVDT